MTANAIEDNSEIIVSGNDMFGASFTEKAHLLILAEGEFSFSLFRPVAENQPIRVSFHPEEGQDCHWIEALIVNVKNRLDGMQTVEVKIVTGFQAAAGSSQGNRPSCH
jgi:hypothetical protein